MLQYPLPAHMLKTYLLSILLLSCFLSAFSQSKSEHDRYVEEVLKRYRTFIEAGESDSLLYLGLEYINYAESYKNDDDLLSSAYNLMGNAYASRSEHASMLDYYMKALTLSEKINDRNKIALIAGNVSFAYIEIENYPEAIAYARKSIQYLNMLSESEKNKIKKFDIAYIDAENSMGESFINLKQPDSALIHLTNGYNILLTTKDSANFSKSFILMNLARSYAMLKDLQTAESFFKQSIEVSKNMPIPAAKALYYYGQFLMNQGRIKEAKKYALIGLSMAKKSDFKKSVIQISQLLQDIYAATSRVDSAFYYSRMMNNYKDSVFNIQSQLAVQNVTFKREVEEKNELQRMQDQENRRTHNIQLTIIAIAIFTLIILFLLLSRTLIVEPRVIHFLSILVLLIVFEFINLIVHPTLEEITDHSPFLMLLGLVLVAAVIVPLHHRLEKIMFKKVVEKNKEIRLRAAKKIIKEFEGEQNHSDDV